MSLVMGVVVLLVLRSAGLNHPDQHAARYGLRLGLGIVLLAAAVLVTARKPRQPDPAKAHGLVSRMVAEPAPLSAFLVGLLVFAPGVTFIAALQVIATASAGPDLTSLAVILVVVINVLLVWLPIMLHLIAPTATERRLKAFNHWIRAHGTTVLIGVLIVAGGIMVFDGIYGLV
jgi:hypothetical protein